MLDNLEYNKLEIEKAKVKAKVKTTKTILIISTKEVKYGD